MVLKLSGSWKRIDIVNFTSQKVSQRKVDKILLRNRKVGIPMKYIEMNEMLDTLNNELTVLQSKHISELGDAGTKRMKELYKEIENLEEELMKAWEEA